MPEVNGVPGILDVIKRITANGESGRLEISSAGTHGSGTHGVLLFTEGKLVDARLESLSGFQAVNAAISLRDAEFSFDHVVPAPHAVAITPSERVVLKQFFGIEAAEMEEPVELVELDPGWNETPEQVVPLAQVEELPQPDLEETPTVEVAAIRSVPVVEDAQFEGAAQPVAIAARSGSARWFAFLLRPQIAIGLVLLLGLVVGAMTLRARFQARQQSEVANVVAADSNSATPDARPVTSESRSDASNANAVPDGPAEARPLPRASQSVALPQRPSAKVSQRQEAPVRNSAASQPLATEQRDKTDEQDPTVHDLNGEWRVINVVEKTNYKSFHNLQLGFRVKINQKGKEFTATGEKVSENGQVLPAGSRTPITLTGSIEGDKVIATFVEDGQRRRSNGRFEWTLQGGDRLTGTFVSTAGNNRGRSAVTKQD